MSLRGSPDAATDPRIRTQGRMAAPDTDSGGD
jgi:hypothetical protein